ncbi:hypothetical protein JCM8547_002012 [Rhodosporidiobolus lusitaniae]
MSTTPRTPPPVPASLSSLPPETLSTILSLVSSSPSSRPDSARAQELAPLCLVSKLFLPHAQDALYSSVEFRIAHSHSSASSSAAATDSAAGPLEIDQLSRKLLRTLRLITRLGKLLRHVEFHALSAHEAGFEAVHRVVHDGFRKLEGRLDDMTEKLVGILAEREVPKEKEKGRDKEEEREREDEVMLSRLKSLTFKRDVPHLSVFFNVLSARDGQLSALSIDSLFDPFWVLLARQRGLKSLRSTDKQGWSFTPPPGQDKLSDHRLQHLYIANLTTALAPSFHLLAASSSSTLHSLVLSAPVENPTLLSSALPLFSSSLRTLSLTLSSDARVRALAYSLPSLTSLAELALHRAPSRRDDRFPPLELLLSSTPSSVEHLGLLVGWDAHFVRFMLVRLPSFASGRDRMRRRKVCLPLLGFRDEWEVEVLTRVGEARWWSVRGPETAEEREREGQGEGCCLGGL